MTNPFRYAGLCLGGPLDGKAKVSETGERFRAYWPTAVPERLPSDVPSFMDVTTDLFEYRHVRFHFEHEQRTKRQRLTRDFWVTAQNDFPELLAIDLLTAGYRMPDARGFRNICAIMMNLDLDELERAGVITPGAKGGSDWQRFNHDPLIFVWMLDDERREKLWQLILSRGALRS